MLGGASVYPCNTFCTALLDLLPASIIRPSMLKLLASYLCPASMQFQSAADYEAYLRQNFPSLPEDAVKVRNSRTCLAAH